MRNQLIDVRPVAGGIGAEIFGPDLSEDLSEEMVAAVRSALLKHCVIFFRDQKFPMMIWRASVGNSES